MEKAAGMIGMAFQIRDDILDVTGDEKKLGKPIGSDERNNKSTYVTFAGIDKAKSDVLELSNEAIDIIRPYIKDDDLLIELIEYLTNRDN